MGEARRAREAGLMRLLEALDGAVDDCRGEARKFHAALTANLVRHGIPPLRASLIVAQAMREEGTELVVASLPTEGSAERPN